MLSATMFPKATWSSHEGKALCYFISSFPILFCFFFPLNFCTLLEFDTGHLRIPGIHITSKPLRTECRWHFDLCSIRGKAKFASLIVNAHPNAFILLHAGRYRSNVAHSLLCVSQLVCACDMMFLWEVIKCVTWTNREQSKFFGCNFATDHFWDSTHMEKLECIIVHRSMPLVSSSASLSLATPTICTI